MENPVIEIPDTIEQLQEQNVKLHVQVAELSAKVKWYEEQFRLAQQKRFGTSSERSHPDQLLLFNEAESEADPARDEPALETVTYKRKKQQGKREAQLRDLPVETIEYRLPENDQVCPCCDGALHEMSTEVRAELKVTPAEVSVVRKVRYVYSCRKCERENTETPVITAPMPNPALPGSLASPSMLAYTMVQKYGYALPLYRLEEMFSSLGVELSRQTLANWMIEGSSRWLQLLYNRMQVHLRARDILHADETTLQVLREPGRSAESQSYLWLYRTGREGPAIVLYEYKETRGGEHPRKFLSGFRGYLHVDGYSGYHKVEDVTLVGCWSHARRKFDEALKALPDGKQKAAVTTREGLDFCNRLFAIERDMKDSSPEERLKIRTEQSRAVLDAFLAWLRMNRSRVLPKSKLGEAIAYCLNQWAKLEAFMLDGRLELDNNRSERSIKPFVIGRKNWLFSNTPRGAKASATIYSIIETAKENGLNPFAYFTWLFEELPQLADPKDPQALDKLLPWSDALPQTCRKPIQSDV
ncbi:IS66 family transposase [Paenibacillus darwinianus]|uniref:IS66 family transposase n=2 Tax=Paenibacillus darwinianus TaxID=1380763 RepID=UPI0005630CA3|nr:IS66 family transposase [Paenibacillus darwinianus]